MSPDERKAFILIAKSYLAMLMPDYEYEQTKITLQAGVEFVVTGNVPQKLGWKAVYDQAASPDAKDAALPSIMDQTPGTITKCEVEGKQTKPPSHYTEGTLIADMKAIAKFVTDPEKKARLKETSGIGTEATRASIIKNLRQKDFLKASGKKILSTEKGQELIGLLEKHLPALADAGETAVWEEGMEAIVEGKGTLDAFLVGICGQVERYITALGNAVASPAAASAPKPPPQAPAPIALRSPSGGAVMDCGDHWTIEGYKGRFGKILCGRKMAAEEYVFLLTSPQPIAFEGFVSKAGKPFKAKLKYDPNHKYNGKPAPGVAFVFDK